MINRDHFASYVAQILNIAQFKDYCPNGLQLEGSQTIKKIVSGVTASRALIDAAIAENADTILVHHGYFWRDENPCIVGMKYERIKRLIQHDINLFAYHLPLDHHPVWGNNAQIAQLLQLEHTGHFADNDLGWLGRAPQIKTIGELAKAVRIAFDREPLLIGDPNQALETIAWCSGGAQSLLPQAAQAGANIYLSGEISEQTVHQAREMDIAYLACGHHASERLGVQALGAHLAEKFNLLHQFIDIPNPA